MTRSYVKIFGERNTSTNAMRRIVLQNSDSAVIASQLKDLRDRLSRGSSLYARLFIRQKEARIDHAFSQFDDRMAWKHCATRFDSTAPFADAFVIFCVRHPASWFQSLYQNPYHLLGRLPASLAEFADFGWQTVGRERLDRRRMTPLELYNEKLRSYAAFERQLRDAEIPHVFIRFEDMVLRQAEVFEKLAPHLDNPNRDFRELAESTKPGGKDLDYYKRYYGEELWKGELAGSGKVVNSTVDWELASRFGYQPV